MNKEEIIFETEEPTEVYKSGLIENLAKETAKNMDDYVFNLIRQNKELQVKVNQLETNRDEAIEYINSQSPYAGVCGKTIRTILERGKE